jgi:hypothetical protein
MTNKELLKFVRDAEADIAVILQDVVMKAKGLGFHLDNVHVEIIDVTTFDSTERATEVCDVDINLVKEVDLEIPERLVKAHKVKRTVSLEETIYA